MSAEAEIEEIDISKNDTDEGNKFPANETCISIKKMAENQSEVEDIMIVDKDVGESTEENGIIQTNGDDNFSNESETASNSNEVAPEHGNEEEIVTLEEIKTDHCPPASCVEEELKNASFQKGKRNSEEMTSVYENENDKATKKICLSEGNANESEINDSGKSSKSSGGDLHERKDDSKQIGYQVQCVNLHCKSGYGLAEAPVFVLTYFGVKRRKNVLQKVCDDCYQIAFKHQQELVYRLKNRKSMFKADFPKETDVVVVMDPEEEIQEEENLPQNVVQQVEEHLMDLIEEALEKYDVNYQCDQAQQILDDKYRELSGTNKYINDLLNSMERKIRHSRNIIYKDFTPRIKNLTSLDIIELDEELSAAKSLLKVKSVSVKKVNLSQKNTLLPVCNTSKEATSHDIVSVEEVEVPPNKLPPIGNLLYPKLSAGDTVYIVKISFIGVWVRGKILEVLPRNADVVSSQIPPCYRVRLEVSYRGGYTRIVSGKHLAYSKPSAVRYPVGTRVIALFKDADVPTKEAYYVGLIAEPPKHINKFRYLVFFDDGYAQYVPHEKILPVCEFSRYIHEDIHPESRDFIKKYFDQYPERPMVKLQKGQIVRTEWNGKWWIARVVEIDGSLAKVHFDADGRTEWIYRGSTRLGPLYSEFVAAAARKEQGALSRHRSLGIASLKKRNMPYVEYSVDQDDAKTPNSAGITSKNVAKKSTTSKTNTQESLTEKCYGPPRPFEQMEYVSKGYIRSIDLTDRKCCTMFVPHQCGPPCIDSINFSCSNTKGINPLIRPLIYGFERQIVKVKGKRGIFYRSPCGRRLRNMVEIHRYLRITKLTMGLDLFDFDPQVHVLNEFHLEPDMYVTHLTDISFGRESNVVSCVNEINHTWPSFMEYATSRIPQGGVNICLDEEFLVCCDCTDDCQDKEKCECWQLTIEGTKFGPEGVADPSVGYQYKRLLEPVTTGIYECNQRCKCSSTCLNRVAQLPLQLNLQVFRTLKKGWGIRALNDIPQGCFICIYAGRLHTEQSANDDGRMYGDEYLAELDYIEVAERFKEGYESDVIEPTEEDQEEEEEDCEDGERYDDQEENMINEDDTDYVPVGLRRLPRTQNVVNTRARKKQITSEDKSESEGEKEKDDIDSEENMINVADDDDDEMKKKPSKFAAAVAVDEERPRKYKSVREMFGDGADDCYIMDAKSTGNIGRYLNHSCQPNVFVQNVFVDTHDVRFPWVAFFALTYISAGTELTWDYNYDVGSVPDKVLYCYCNNAECRGRLL